MMINSRPRCGQLTRVQAVVTTVFALFSPIALPTSNAQSSPAAPVSQGHGRVTGVVFDSLRRAPVAGAHVWINGTTHAAVTDERGRYDIESVPAGRHILAFSAPSTDSLGFGPHGAALVVRARETSKVQLATASLSTIWKTVCGSRPRLGPDSGIVWGTVQDASTNRLLDGAATQFQWYEFKKGLSNQLELSDLTGSVRTDSTGTYYACGLPTDVAVSLRAFGAKMASGDVSYTLGRRSLQRIDLAVSGDMFATGDATSGALGGLLRGRGTATIRGVVMNDKGQPMAEALVSVSSADTVVRSGKDGTYLIRNMPAGTQSVEVRTIGFAMKTRLVNTRPNETTEVNFAMQSATTLATFNVRAAKTVSARQSEFLFRRQMGMGYARTIDGEGYSNAIQVLTSIPRLNVEHRGGTPSVTMVGVGRQCAPRVFFDGRRSTWEEIYERPLETFRSVEVFNPYQIPLEFQSPVSNGTCGVVAYWSKLNFDKVGELPPP